MKRSNSESNSENEDNLNDNVTNMSSGGGSNASGGGGGGGGGNNNNNRGGQKRFRKEETVRLLIPSRVSRSFRFIFIICTSSTDICNIMMNISIVIFLSI